MNTQQGRLARQQARRRRRERFTGVAVAVLGIVVLVVAVVALRSPKRGAVSADGSQSSVAHQSQSTTAGTSPSATRSTSSAPRKHRTKSASSTAASSGSSASSSGSGSTAAKSVPLIVLNNTTVSGLAKTAAAQFEAGGWTVSSTGNLRNDIASTCAYYDPSQPGAQDAALALQQQFPTIKRTKERFAELPPGPVVVVLTPDYSTG